MKHAGVQNSDFQTVRKGSKKKKKKATDPTRQDTPCQRKQIERGAKKKRSGSEAIEARGAGEGGERRSEGSGFPPTYTGALGHGGRCLGRKRKGQQQQNPHA